MNDDEDGDEEGSDEVCFCSFFCDYLLYQSRVFLIIFSCNFQEDDDE